VAKKLLELRRFMELLGGVLIPPKAYKTLEKSYGTLEMLMERLRSRYRYYGTPQKYGIMELLGSAVLWNSLYAYELVKGSRNS
jgi:hypothetical protein